MFSRPTVHLYFGCPTILLASSLFRASCQSCICRLSIRLSVKCHTDHVSRTRILRHFFLILLIYIYILNISVSVMNRQSEIEWLAREWETLVRFPAGVLLLTTTSKSALWFRLYRNRWVTKANCTLTSAMKLSNEYSLSYTSPQFFTASNMPCPCICAGSGQFVNLGLHSGEEI